MRILLSLLILAFSSSYANEVDYKQYSNKELGVSFEYPSWAEVEDISRKGRLNILFHVGEWPKKLKYKGDIRPRSPISGVSFGVKSKGDFQDFLAQERADQIKGGYQNEIKENQYSIGKNIKGIEFIRNSKKMNKTIHYFIFPSLKKKVILSFWHLQDMETGFMGYPEEEAKAVIEYQHMIKTLRIFK